MTNCGASLWSTVSPPRTTSARMPATRPRDSSDQVPAGGAGAGRRPGTTRTIPRVMTHVDQAVAELDPGVELEGGDDARRRAARPVAAAQTGPGQAHGRPAHDARRPGRPTATAALRAAKAGIGQDRSVPTTRRRSARPRCRHDAMLGPPAPARRAAPDRRRVGPPTSARPAILSQVVSNAGTLSAGSVRPGLAPWPVSRPSWR